MGIIILLPHCVYRISLWHKQAQMTRLGGTIITGHPPIYSQLAYSSHSPRFVREACFSKGGQWIFSQFPVVYGIDLRRVGEQDDVDSALRIMMGFDGITQITFYQSAVTDEHLALLAAAFPKLKQLKINETAITDVGIGHLCDLPELQLLNAQRTALTDTAVPALAAIRQLKELNIAETQITSVQPIRNANPSCYINHQLVTKSHSTDYHRISGQLR